MKISFNPFTNAIALFLVALASFYVTSDAKAEVTGSWENLIPQEELDELLLQDRDLWLESKSLVKEDTSRNFIASKLSSSDAKVVPNHIKNKYPSKKVTATGYTAGEESTGKNPGDELYGITFSGVQVLRDTYSTIAADPDVFPIGSILFIPGYGYGVVADTGSAINGDIIDLYYDTVDEVFNEWGKQKVDVYVVKEGDGSFTEKELVALNEE